jgi:hypothetical protein
MISAAANGHPAAEPRPLVKLAATAVALGSVLIGKAMIACRLRRAPEGWRRTLGILLRSEPTRFALSTFGLHVPEGGRLGAREPAALDTRIAARLLSFLATEPDACFSLDWRPWVTERRRTRWVDVALLRFDADGDLAAIEPHLSPAAVETLDSELREQVHRIVVEAYNRTRQLPEVRRPSALLDEASARLPSPGARAYANRLLAACCLSIERSVLTDPAQRFAPPDFCARRTLGFGYLSVVARPDAAGRTADIWVNAHHVGLDGVPLQELVTRLEQAWGTGNDVTFPCARGDTAFVGPRVCSAPGERRVHHSLTFVDFSPVVALRRDLSARLREAIGGEVTFGALLAWLLNREPEFAGVRIASTVDVAASDGYDRDVDVVVLRPADFVRGEGPWDGLVEYAREFNRLVAAARARTSPIRRGMQTAGLLPAWAHIHSIRANPAVLDNAFGTLCITIVRDAKVFVAPMSDLGMQHGFFAIGNVNLPAADGGHVASVSIKGDAGKVAHHPAVLQRVIDRCASLDGLHHV